MDDKLEFLESGYYRDENDYTGFTGYICTHKPEDKYIYKDSWKREVRFMRDIILEKFGGKCAIIGTHYSKSIEHPVILTSYNGVNIVWQCNLYDWQIMIDSPKPILFSKDMIEFANIAVEDPYLYYQGIPDEYCFKKYDYENNNQKFGISISCDSYDFNITSFIAYLLSLIQEVLYMDYKQELEKPEYSFLKTNEHLGDNIILLALGGSRAYGTNTETSDVDIRGIALEKPKELIGMSKFEVYEDKETDTTIYGFNKICHMLAQCNPNIIEILGLKPDQYLKITPLGQKLLDNKNLFVSKKCYYTFGKYAISSLKNLEMESIDGIYPKNCIALENAVDSFNTQHNTNINPTIAYVDDNDDLRYKLNIDVSGTNINPTIAYVDDNDDLRYKLNIDVSGAEFENLYSAISNTTKNYKELLKRNRKKTPEQLNKHAMHLVRLLLMCIDLLKTGEIVTYREKDHNLLMSIRNGYYMDENHKFTQGFYDLVNSLMCEYEDAYQKSTLPDLPDMQKIEEFIMEVNRENLKRGE